MVAVRDVSETVAGLIGVHVSPDGSGLSDRFTVPMKPLVGIMAIVDVALTPVCTESGDVAVRPKLGCSGAVTIRVIVTKW